jgi:hypothetical protein
MIRDPIRYSLGSSNRDNVPKQCEASDFGAFADAIRSRKSAKKGQMYFCGPMAVGVHEDRRKYQNSATYRLSRLALPKRFLCLDHDGYQSPELFKDLIERLNGNSGFAYTTFSSTPQAPRARIVLELDRGVDRAEGIAVGEAFDRQLTAIYGQGAIKSDSSVYRAEQPCYGPGEDSQFFLLHGNPLCVDELLGGACIGISKRVIEVGPTRRPTRAAIVRILKRLDPFPEPIWFKVGCILARIYGEEGREFFLTFSRGDYWITSYRNYDDKEANRKYDRALKEAEIRDSGAGIGALLKMSQLSINDIEFEPLEIYENSVVKTKSDDPLGELISGFSLLILGSQIRVIRQEEVAAMRANKLLRGIGLYQRRDAELMMRRYLVERELSYSPAEISAFFLDRRTLVYEATAFHPGPQPENVLNYWVDPISPVAGSGTECLHEFIREVICASDQTLTKYVTDFLAHMLKYPEVKPGVAIILLGGQGIGKGTFFELLRAIWKKSILIVQDVEQVVGKFNSALERHFVVCMDEAIFRGDRKASEKLKALVTEPLIRIEEKYEPSRTIESFHRFFAATNSNHFGQVDVDDRRYVFLRVSSHRRCQHDYFSKLHATFECERIMEAFVHELHNREISPLSIFSRPVTAEHTAQRVYSLQGFDRFWHDFLVRESVPNAGGPITTESLLALHQEFNKREERFSSLQANELSRKLCEVCPSVAKTRVMIAGDTGRRGYILPPISVCRLEFEAYIGAKLDWDIAPGEQPTFSTVF